MMKKSDELDYSSKSEELENILVALQRPDIGIDEATKLHADGLKIVTELEAYLKQAEVIVKQHVTDSE
jgi:exodeoxyribonuclease VII small subunit